MTHVEESFGWLAYAEDTLRHAADNFERGIYNVAVALSYFAAFRAAKSVLAYLKQDDPKIHSGVVGKFGEPAVRGSDFPAPTAKNLARLFEHRLKADYDQAYRHTLTRETTAREIGRAETFVAEVSNWLQRHHRP